MAKRREEIISKTRDHKRPRQENTDESGHEPDEVTRSHLQSGSSSCSELVSCKLQCFLKRKERKEAFNKKKKKKVFLFS